MRRKMDQQAEAMMNIMAGKPVEAAQGDGEYVAQGDRLAENIEADAVKRLAKAVAEAEKMLQAPIKPDNERVWLTSGGTRAY